MERLDQRLDQSIRRLKECVDELAGRIGGLDIDTDQNRRNNRGPVDRPALIRRQDNPLFSESSEEETSDFDEERSESSDYGGRNRHGEVHHEGNRYGENRRGYDDREGNDFKLKVDIPYFNGSLGIEDFLDWIADIDKFFDYMETPSAKKVRLVACRLKGGASAWWERLQNRRLREGKDRVHTWTRMRRLLKQEFLPPDYEQIMFQQYQRCQQDNRSVHEYTAEFMRLAERNNLVETEGQQVARYLDGLKPSIQDKIGVQFLRNLTEAKNLAMKAELMQQDRGKRGYEDYRGSNSSSLTAKSAFNNCYNAGQSQENKALEKRPTNESKDKGMQAVKAATPNPYAKPGATKCYRCNQLGHRSNECPQRKTVNMVAREEEEEGYCCGPDGDEDDFEDEVEETRHIHALIVKQTSEIEPEIQVEEHPDSGKPLLNEFCELTPEEISDGLSPTREIQHTFNLIHLPTQEEKSVAADKHRQKQVLEQTKHEPYTLNTKIKDNVFVINLLHNSNSNSRTSSFQVEENDAEQLRNAFLDQWDRQKSKWKEKRENGEI